MGSDLGVRYEDRTSVAAIHAIGLVLAEHLGSLMRDEPREADPNAAYEQALRALTAESWRAV